MMAFRVKKTRALGVKYFEELGKTLRGNPNALCTFVVVS
jgi:hypothetical protein